MSESPAADRPSGTATPPPRKRRRWRIVLLCALVLVFGFASGFVSALVALGLHLRGLQKDPERVQTMVMRRLDRKLDLTDAQEAEVRVIVKEMHESLMALREESAPKVHAEFEKARGRINEVLTEEQRKEFDEMLLRFKRRWGPGGGGGGHGRHGPATD